MSIKIKKMFKSCVTASETTSHYNEVLDKVLGIKNPLDFTEDFVSDKDLQELEEELDRKELVRSKADEFRKLLADAPATKSRNPIFI